MESELRMGASPEQEKPRYDAIVVLGKNIGVEWGPEEIKTQRFHLSDHARINVLAAGILYQQGLTDKIIFSSGETVRGYNEAHLMKAHLLRIFRGSISEDAVIPEDRSRDTQQNAEEVKKIVYKYGFRNIGLVTVGFHIPRADMLFKKEGIEVEDISAEDVVAQRFPEMAQNYRKSDLYEKELKKEETAKKIQSIPLLGTLASTAVRIKRSLNT